MPASDEQGAAPPAPNPRDTLSFCPGCFATNEDGSMGGRCDEHHCDNCGNTGTLRVPRWAVESIRRQASWVGKRFYPKDEDLETQAELDYWRERAPEFPDDTFDVQEHEGELYLWIKRPLAGRVRSTSVRLPDRSTEAIEAAKRRLRAAFPYPPALDPRTPA